MSADPQAIPARRPALRLVVNPSIVGLVGNPRAQSRTSRMVSGVAEAFASASGGRVAAVLELAEIMDVLFDFSSARVAAALDQILAADVLVVGSPTYKGTYPGLLKAFCDHIGGGQLGGLFAVPTMIGGAPNHALAVEVHLRALLVELGATCATPGLFFLESQLEDLATVAREYVEQVGLGVALRSGA